MVPEDSYTLRFQNTMDEYGQRGKTAPVAYFRNVNQSDPGIQEQMEEYINDLVSMREIGNQPPFFWLRDYKFFANNTRSVQGMPFYQQLAIFLAQPEYQKMYGSSIVLKDDGEIESSRCVLYMQILTSQTPRNKSRLCTTSKK